MSKIFSILIILNFIIACDYTPKVHKKILTAQEKIKDQEIDFAIEIYKETLDYHLDVETRVKILFQLGELYSLYKADLKTAINYYTKVLEITNDINWLVKAEEKRGELNFTFLKDFSEALKSYKHLFDFRPRLKNFDFYHYRYAIVLSRLKNYKKAEVELKNISKSDSGDFKLDANFELGLLYFEQKKWAKTIKVLEEYIKVTNSRDKIVKAKFIVANCHETLENLVKAYNIYYSILKDYPEPKIVEEKLEAIYNRRVARKR